MSERTALPIGSVVRVREGVEPVMIVNHCPVTEKDGKQGYFDFGAVILKARTIAVPILPLFVRPSPAMTSATWRP